MTRPYLDETVQCEGKIAFEDYDRAKRYLAPGNNIYRCPHCRFWHIGRSNKRVSQRGRPHQLFKGFSEDERSLQH